MTNKKTVYPKSFDSKKYPEFIRKNVFLKAFPKPKKAFPKIGLKNCESALNTVKLTGACLYKSQLIKFRNALEDIGPTKKTVMDDEYDTFEMDCEDLSATIDDDLEYDGADSYFVSDKLILPERRFIFTGLGKSVKLAKNPLISDLVKEIVKFCKKRHIKCDKLSSLSFKDRTLAVDVSPWKNKKNLKICFSSENEKGYWDIATMSMRKISSCMKWTSSHAKSLVGSIIDPYTGLIYITDGTYTKYGKSMLARSVVRFVVRGSSNTPYIMIEQAYPRGVDGSVAQIFQAFIQQRVNLPVIIADSDDWGDSYVDYRIPTTEQIESIIELDQDDDSTFLSYRDSGIEYNKVPKFYNPNKIKSYAR